MQKVRLTAGHPAEALPGPLLQTPEPASLTRLLTDRGVLRPPLPGLLSISHAHSPQQYHSAQEPQHNRAELPFLHCWNL